MNISNGTLTPKQREVGLQLIEDPEFVYLKNNKGTNIAIWTVTGATIEKIHEEAEKWLKEQNSASLKKV